MNRLWSSEAPANIALIKYMGKKDPLANIPDNPSLSYTLPNLITRVTLSLLPPGEEDTWEPLADYEPLPLSPKGIHRFLTHLDRIKQRFGYTGAFAVKSGNNFPHGAGLASSASSFAALTQCAVLALSDLTGQPLPTLESQAELSRLGSGSSCRSFFTPWALWDEACVKPIDLPYMTLHHGVITVDAREKAVSSSEAHRRVTHNQAYLLRPSRAKARLDALLGAFNDENWSDAYQIVWEEFEDMHALFETANPAFSYRTPQTHRILAALKDAWRHYGDGPLVTMDAGPNIHVLFRNDQALLVEAFKAYLAKTCDVTF